MAITEKFLASKILQLVAVMSESLLVGSYLILTILVCCILVTKYRALSVMLRVLLGASIFMFAISAVHLGLVIQELGVPAHPLENGRAQIILSTSQFLIGELILLWRVWIIWERSFWIIIVPILLMGSAAGLTLNLLSSRDMFFTVAPVILIVANATFCTSVIAGKIWYMQWKVRSMADVTLAYSSSWWKGTVALVVESGVLYTAVQVVSLVLHYQKNIALPILLDLQVPLIGILPTLIIVLVHHDLPDVGQSQASGVARGAVPRTSKINLETGSIDYHYSVWSEGKANHYQRHSTASSYVA